MRKHEGFTPCEGAGRIRPQARDRRVQGRTAAPSARHHLFRKANVRRREPQVPQEQSGHRESRGCQESQALIIRGGPARNRVVFINSRRERGKKGLPSESCGAYDLALCLRSFAVAKYEGREAPSEGPPLMKTTRFLAGLPLLFRHEGSRGVLARANARIEPNSAARSTRRSRPRVRGRPCKRRG